MRFDRLSQNDRAVLVEMVQSVFSGGGAEAAAALLDQVSTHSLRLLRTLHAEEIVKETVKLWVAAPRSRSMRAFRAALAGALMPTYRSEAVRHVEEALAGSTRRGQVVDVQYEVKR